MKKFINFFFRIKPRLQILKSRTIYIYLAAAIVVIVMLLWLAGSFSPKINYKNIQPTQAQNYDYQTVKARLTDVPLTETASGTVQAVHETTITSKLTARVMKIYFKAGEQVNKGQLLVSLDDTELQAKLEQAKAGIVFAEAANKQAVKDQERFAKLYQTKSVSKQDYENADTRLKTSKAELDRAKGVVGEIESLIRYANIVSPINGLVVDKQVDVGDTVMPGQVLLKIYDQKKMQMIANVRESLANKLKIGQDIGVKVDALDKICSGSVSEIVPEANSANRTFRVKVVGPCPPGIYSGMFGRIIIPVGDEKVLLIPKDSIIKTGQLELVNVVQNGTLSKRYVRSGRTFGDDIEILSGLKDGESVLLPYKKNSN